MGRYEVSLCNFANNNPASFTEQEMIDNLYGLTQEIRGVWKNPSFVAKGGQTVVVKAYNTLLEDHSAIRFSLPISIKEERKKNIFSFLNKREKEELLDMKQEFEQRFKRGAKYQKWLYESAKKNNLFKYGYIPEVHSTPNDNSRLHYAMEYIDAMPLMNWAKTQTSKEKILDVYRNILKFILHAFHDFGAIHRDLKPDNIMVSKNNHPIILDFGLVKIMNKDSENLTHNSTILGNAKWSSPIQQRASKHCSFKDDVYTLGLLFWSLATKEIPPFPPGRDPKKVPIWEIFPPSEIPRELEEFSDFFQKASCDDQDLRYPNLEIALEGFDQCFLSWKRKKNTTIVNNTTNRIRQIDWETARQGIKNEKLEDGIKKIIQGIEMIFFTEKEQK